MAGVTFHCLAERELHDAAEYYELESAGLGVAFLAAVEQCARAILQHPEAGVVVRGSVRRRLVRRFPYAILYSIKPREIRVFGACQRL